MTKSNQSIPNQSPRIVILDDHSMYSEGLKRIISDFCPTAEFECFTSISSLHNSTIDLHETDLLISDIELPNEDVFELFRVVKEKYPDLPILVITMHKKLSVIRKCLDLRIEGYILKDEDHLLELAFKSVVASKSFFSPEVLSHFQKVNDHNDENISQREEEIIKLLCQGHSNHSIAEKLFISIETIKTHKKNIKRKIGYTELHELIEFAEKRLLL